MKQVSILKVMEYEQLKYAVIISESNKPHQTYCIYHTKDIAMMNAGALASELKCEFIL